MNPTQTVDPRRDPIREAFSPPHCVNPRCVHHRAPDGWRWQRHGAFIRAGDRMRIPRFRCLHCNRTFSTETFRTTYWLKRRDVFRRVAELVVAGACLRQIARAQGLAHSTVARHLARAGRHALLFHQRRLGAATLTEPIAFDGFESFEHSQFFPFHFHLAVGARSWALLHFTDSPLRRSGRMTVEQTRRRAELERTLGRPDPRAVETDVAELLDTVAPAVAADLPITLLSDEHRSYPRAVRRLRSRLPGRTIVHRTTPSTQPRTRANALFPVNLADLLIRHSAADHKRETIAFAKRRQASAERLAVHLVWRNYVKRRRENGGAETAAMVAGLARRPLHFREIFSRRLFRSRIALPVRWAAYYERRVGTAPCRRNAVHDLAYAF